MRINQEIARRFTFGQIETRKRDRQYILRGDIEIIVIGNGRLEIVCHWVALKDISESSDGKWTSCHIRSFAYVVDQYHFDEQRLQETGTLELTNPNDPYEDQIVLYPPDGDRLDPRHVEGIELPEPIHP